LQPAVIVGGFPIAAAAPMGNPDAAGRPHDWIERGHQSAGRPNPGYATVNRIMDIRFAIGDDDHADARQAFG
jgi:hypothetical protein